MVAAAQIVTNTRQGHLGQLTQKIHRHLTRIRERTGARLRLHILNGHIKILRHRRQNQRRRNLRTTGIREQILQIGLSLSQGNGLRRLLHRGGSARTNQSALQLANIGRDMGSNVLHDVIAHRQNLVLSLLPQNRDTSLQLRRLHIHIQARAETRTHTLSETGQLLRRQIRGNHDLLLVVVQGVKRMEELLHRRLFTRQKLDIVNQQNVNIAVNLLERRTLIVTNRVNEIVRELLRIHVAHPQIRVQILGVVADRVQQVGLTQTRTAVDEQRVVDNAGLLRHRESARVRKAVGLTNHEGVEGVVRVQSGRAIPSRRVFRVFMRMHLLGLRYRRGVRNESGCRVLARRTRDRSRRSSLLRGGEPGTLRLQSLQGGAGDLLIGGHLVVVRARMRLGVVLKSARTGGRLRMCRSRRNDSRCMRLLSRHLTLTMENVLTCRFNRNHRLIHIEKRGGRRAKSLVQSRTERSANLLLKDRTGELIRHLNDEARRTHQSLRLRKIHETALTCRHRRIGGKNGEQMRPARLKGVGHGILYFHSM